MFYPDKYSHKFSNFTDIIIQFFQKASVMTVATLIGRDNVWRGCCCGWTPVTDGLLCALWLKERMKMVLRSWHRYLAFMNIYWEVWVIWWRATYDRLTDDSLLSFAVGIGLGWMNMGWGERLNSAVVQRGGSSRDDFVNFCSLPMRIELQKWLCSPGRLWHRWGDCVALESSTLHCWLNMAQ